MISGDRWGLSFPDICLTVEEKPRKNLNRENWPLRVSNSGPLGKKQQCYSSTTAVIMTLRRFTYLTAHSPTLPLLIHQPFHHFTYSTAHSPTLLLLHLHHSSFFNPSFASPMSQALHLRHLASHPWKLVQRNWCVWMMLIMYYTEWADTVSRWLQSV